MENPEKFVKDIIALFNKIRTNPKSFAQTLRQYKSYFKGKVLKIPGSSAGLMTKEGPSAYEEAAQFLEDATPVKELKYSHGLCHACHDFVTEVQRLDDVDQTDSVDMQEIVDKYGQFSGSFSRAIDFGSNTPELVFANLIVGDGDPDRGQRVSIMDKKFCEVGVSCGEHSTYRCMTVIATATKFNENAAAKAEIKLITEKLKSTKVQDRKNDDEDDDELPPGVKSIDKSEKIVTEKGRKMKVIKLVKHMEDGSTETETTKEPID